MFCVLSYPRIRHQPIYFKKGFIQDDFIIVQPIYYIIKLQDDLSKFQPIYYHPKAIYTVILIFYKAQQMISQWFTSTYRIVLYLKYKLGLLIHDQCFVQDIHCNPRQLFHARHLKYLQDIWSKTFIITTSKAGRLYFPKLPHKALLL